MQEKVKFMINILLLLLMLTLYPGPFGPDYDTSYQKPAKVCKWIIFICILALISILLYGYITMEK